MERSPRQCGLESQETSTKNLAPQFKNRVRWSRMEFLPIHLAIAHSERRVRAPAEHTEALPQCPLTIRG